MHPWRHPTSRDLWVAADPALSELRRYGPRSHRSWVFFKTPTRCSSLHTFEGASSASKGPRQPPGALRQGRVSVRGLSEFLGQNCVFRNPLPSSPSPREFAAARGREPFRKQMWGCWRDLTLGFRASKINVYCIDLALGGWRQGCASRCTGGARRGSFHTLLPLSYPVRV